MQYVPIFLDVAAKRVVIAGGGAMAESKLKILLKSEAELHVFAKKPNAKVSSLADEGRISLTLRDIELEDFNGAVMAYSTYFNAAKNEDAIALARQAGVMINVVDTPDKCDFISPAIVDRDPVVVAIGTEGAAPVLARQIKAELEERLPPSTGLMARVAKKFRHAVEVLPFGRVRRDYWAEYFKKDIRDENAAREFLEQHLQEVVNEQEKRGHISILGAGPGDPELLTLKARKRLHEADVVIYDRLVSPEILELARREATLIEVGKTGYGPSWKQDDINALLVKYGQKGELVVRLKGGDPSIYGRLDEEIEALAQAQLAYEIVPGITTASAAVASIGSGLTQRGRNTEIRFLTGRDVNGFVESDWRSLAQDGSAAAVYMGAKAARLIQGRLLMHGANPNKPITAIENVSRVQEKVVATTIGSMAVDIESAEFSGPVIILLGIAPREFQKQFEEVQNAASV